MTLMVQYSISQSYTCPMYYTASKTNSFNIIAKNTNIYYRLLTSCTSCDIIWSIRGIQLFKKSYDFG